MKLTDESKKSLETLSIALVLHLKDIVILGDDGLPVSDNQKSFTFALNTQINNIHITHDTNIRDNEIEYSVHIEIPA